LLPRLYFSFLLTFGAAAVVACSKAAVPSAGPTVTVEIHADAPAATASVAPSQPLASPTPLPADRIKVAATNSTRYYAVYGGTSDELLSYMEAYGPVNDKGARGYGVTHYTFSLDWDSNHDPRACAISRMTINVGLDVVLPALDNPTRLSPVLVGYWSSFTAAVAAHEQHHVDIYLKGADTMRQQMMQLQPTLGCAALEAAVNSLVDAQQALTDQEQGRFHQSEFARIDATRAPIKSQIDALNSQLATLDAQVSGLDASISALQAQMDSLEKLLDSLQSQLKAMEDKYRGTTMPDDIYQQHQKLVSQYNNLIPSYNTLLGQYNGQISQRATLVARFNDLQGQVQDLVLKYNWTG
jgi:predicted secreted Zn-dependent protease